jgi:hypothetical protein
VLDQGVLRRGKVHQGEAAIHGWQDWDPRVLEAICNMPTKKTASMEKLKVYIAFTTQRMDVMLEFSQFKPFRCLRLRSFIFMKKKLRQLCERLVLGGQRVVVGFGDWSNRDVAGIIKKSPAGPVKAFERELARYCTVVSIAVYRTSKVHYDCDHELKNQFSQRLCRDDEIRSQKVYSVLHCSNNGCRGMTDPGRERRPQHASPSRAQVPRRRPSGGVHPAGVDMNETPRLAGVAQQQLLTEPRPP